MSGYDHYEEAASLIMMLRDTSLQGYGEALQNAMDEGATGTEIFMALRWNLEKLLKEEDCRDLVRGQAKRLWEELDRALK